MHTFVHTCTHNSHSLYYRKDNVDFGLDGLSAFSVSHQPCGSGKLLSLNEAGGAHLGAQEEASTDNVGVERFLDCMI